MKKKILLIAVFCVFSSLAAPLFEAENGLLIIEAESTKSSKGQWDKENSIPGFTGECHLEFTGNRPASGPAQNPLDYSFTVDKDGTYRLLIRAYKRLEGEPNDRCNDCYVRLEGDFDTGGKVPLEMLKSDTKLYGGSSTEWGWTAQLDKHHKKFPPLYKLQAGKKYTLTVSGRSQRFNMDRIVFVHNSVSEKKAKDPSQPESKATKN